MAQESFDQLHRRLGNLTQRDIIRAAEQAGWTVTSKGGKGSHQRARKPGRKSVAIPVHRNRETDRQILKDLEKGPD